MRQRIEAPRILTPEEEREGESVLIEDGVIVALGPTGRLADAAVDRTVTAPDGWICPGWIDLHVHGAAGHDTLDATAEAYDAMGRFFARHGVTSYLPTTVSQSRARIDRCLRTIEGYAPPADAARPLGIHLEGPYLSPDYRGAHPAAHLRTPDPAEYDPWLASGQVRLITLAPELPGAEALIRKARASGVQLAAGHTGASFDQMARAVDLGLSQATHLFNAMKGFHHREPAVVGATLTDPRIVAQVIADGVHLHPAALRLVVRAKGWPKILLITDAIRATGLGDGETRLGDEPVSVREGVARTPAGRLAGSTLTLDQAVRNMVALADVSLRDAVGMATLSPARALGLAGRKGGLQPGADADLLILDADLRVQLTMVGGEIAYRDPRVTVA